jgi:hypothetical protein
MSRTSTALALTVLATLGPQPASAQGQSLDRDIDRVGHALHKFFGPLQGHYIQVYPPLVSDQISEGLSGPSDPVKDLPGGLRLVSGCRANSCDEKSAVILSTGHEVQAAAMVNFHCHWTKPPHRTRRGNLNGPSKCEDHPTLTVFLHRSQQSDALDKALQDWAVRVAPMPIPHEVVWLK